MESKMRISLKAARENAGLNQKDAAKRLGVCVATLQNYESGVSVPDWNVVRKIEGLYNIPADNIYFGSKYA